MPLPRLDHCRYCHRPFGEDLARSDESANVCRACRLESCRLRAVAHYRATHPVLVGRGRHGITGHAPGVETWPESHDDPIIAGEKWARAQRYYADILADRPIEFIPAGVRLGKPLQGDLMKTNEEEPTDTCQYCEGWEQETCMNTESDWWNHRRGAGCTCAEFRLRPVRKRTKVTA